METLTNKLKSAIDTVRKNPVRAASALGGVLLVAGGVWGVNRVLAKAGTGDLPLLDHATSAYLAHDKTWYYYISDMSKYGHFAPASFRKLAECATHIIFLTATLEALSESGLKAKHLWNLAKLIGKAVECIRVLRYHVVEHYGHVPSVMEQFDEAAANIQQYCNDVQFNVTNTFEYSQLQVSKVE